MYRHARKVLFLFLRIFPRFPVVSFKFQRDIQRKIQSSRAPGIRIAGFCLFWPTLLQCLLLQAVRNLPLMRSLTDATELYSGMELHISACCPNQTEL